MHEATPLQQCLDPNSTHRGVTEIERYLSRAGLNLESLVLNVMRARSDDEFVFLDAGCGAGHLAEEFARWMPARMAKHELSKRIRAIGLDLNPLPSSLYMNRFATLMKGDVVRMEGLADASVDLAISYATLQYLEDHLRALHSGWRVLKPGGMMLWAVNDQALTQPPLEEIFRHTECPRVFDLIYNPIWDQPTWIICRRKPDLDFPGFPYELNRIERPFTGELPAFRQYITVSHYDFKSPSS